MSMDQFGLVRCGEVFRTVSAWLHFNWQDDQVPFWQRTARFVVNQSNRLMASLNSSLAGVGARAMRSRTLAKTNEGSNAPNTSSSSGIMLDDAELNWSVNIRVGEGSDSISSKMAEPSSRTTSSPDNKIAKETIKFRVGLHPPETAPVDADDLASEDLDDEDSGARLIVCLTLRDDITGKCHAGVSRMYRLLD